MSWLEGSFRENRIIIKVVFSPWRKNYTIDFVQKLVVNLVGSKQDFKNWGMTQGVRSFDKFRNMSIFGCRHNRDYNTGVKEVHGREYCCGFIESASYWN